MLYAILILRDCTHWASLLTRNRNVDDSVIRTRSVALTAADTDLVVDLTLRGLWVELDSVLWAGMLTSTSNATATEVSDIVVCAYARRTSLVDNAHNVILDTIAVEGHLGVVREWHKLVGLVGHIVAEQRQRLVLPHSTLLVDAASTAYL
jgi:hypothetical protein